MLTPTQPYRKELGDGLALKSLADEKDVGRLAVFNGEIHGAVHNIQPDVPPENIWAMYETAREVGRYPISVGNGA